MPSSSSTPAGPQPTDRPAPGAAAKPWFETAFGADYAARYAHRDDAQAEREMKFLLAHLHLPPAARVLDLCCGSGRHLRVLRAQGLDAHGVDLSADLLHLARADHLPVTQCDMRAVPFPDGHYAAVLNLFTSFGYFDDAGNQAALHEMVRLLAPAGTLVIDVLNPVATLVALQPHTEKPIRWHCHDRGRPRAARLVEQRRYDPVARRLEKIVRLWSPDGASLEQEYLESVRVYFHHEWPALMQQAGLRITAAFGTLEGAPFEALTSPRQVLVAARNG